MWPGRSIDRGLQRHTLAISGLSWVLVFLSSARVTCCRDLVGSLEWGTAAALRPGPVAMTGLQLLCMV